MAPPRRSSDIILHSDSGDFIIRRRILPAWQLLLLFTICFCVLFGVASNAEIFGGAIGVALAIFAVIGPLCWFTVYFSQQNRDMLMASEFQNALFSAAARIKSKFVIIVQKDGTIVYFDRGFQSVFPETASRGTLMVDKLFNHKQISPAEAEKLYAALEENRPASVFVHLLNEQGEEQKVILTIDPLPRPSGFFIIRARDYVVKRYDPKSAAQPAQPVAGGAHQTAVLTHMLHTLPYGIYTTDAQGTVLYMNYRLESWLSYGQGEANGGNISLHMLLPQQNTETALRILERDCEGDILMRSKDGRQLEMYLQQQLTYDENGQISGSVAIVQPSQPMHMDIAPVAPGQEGSATQDGNPPTTSLIAGKSF